MDSAFFSKSSGISGLILLISSFMGISRTGIKSPLKVTTSKTA
jgi:hypothetical protein